MACQIIDHREVIVVGSQAILGSYSEEELPAAATMSVEVDILPIAASAEETEQLADLIEGVAAKLCALREKDRNFVAALLDAGLVDAAVIEARLSLLPARYDAAAGRALGWLRSRPSP